MLTDLRRDRFACDTECPFVGTTAAILIGAGISAAAGLGSAAIQSKQVGKAVNAQTAATDKAIEQLKPFQQTGTEAFTTLGSLMGLGGGGGGAAPALGTKTFDPQITPGQANFSRYSPTGGYIGKDVPMAEQMTNHNVALDASGYTAQQHGASPGAAMSPMLKVRAPNGNIYQVPADKAAEAQQNGGTVLGTV